MVTAGSSLALGGASAWLVAIYLTLRGPLPAGRRPGRVVDAMLGAAATAMMLVVAGLALVATGRLL